MLAILRNVYDSYCMELSNPQMEFSDLSKQAQLLVVAQNFLLYSEIVIPRSLDFVEASHVGTTVELSVAAEVSKAVIGTYVALDAKLHVSEHGDESLLMVGRNDPVEYYEDDPFVDYFLETFVRNFPSNLTQTIM